MVPLLGAGHPTAPSALLNLLARGGVSLPDQLLFRSQDATEDIGIPDLVGLDEDGKRVLVIEIKFWAGLTSNQPVGYFQALPQGRPSALVMLCPEERVLSLWHECERRFKEAKIILPDRETSTPGLSLTQADDGRQFGILDWKTLLNTIEASSDQAGDREGASDVRQLRGLTDQMDREAFLPLRPEELSPEIGRRVYQFVGIVDDLVAELRQRGIASTEGLRTGGKGSNYGRYFSLAEHGCFLVFSPQRWFRRADTPLWLTVRGADFKATPEIPDKLAPLRAEKPPRLFVLRGVANIPLFPAVGLERDQVLEGLISQIEEIKTYLEREL